eukprot:923-Heterococcus_DN1.PRE.3
MAASTLAGGNAVTAALRHTAQACTTPLPLKASGSASCALLKSHGHTIHRGKTQALPILAWAHAYRLAIKKAEVTVANFQPALKHTTAPDSSMTDSTSTASLRNSCVTL